MGKFRFKFDAVLKTRKIMEHEALRVLSVQEKLYKQQIDHKVELLAKLDGAKKRLESLGKEPTGISSFLAEQDFIIGLKQRIIQADHAILKAKKSVDKARRFFVAARAQSRAMETLYDKAYREHKKEMEKLEQKRIDEMVLMRFRFQEENG